MLVTGTEEGKISGSSWPHGRRYTADGPTMLTHQSECVRSHQSGLSDNINLPS